MEFRKFTVKVEEILSVVDIASINIAHSFEEVADIVVAALKRYNKPVGMVCGAISTGGFGSVEANLQVFNRAISTLQLMGRSIFSQMALENAIERLRDKTVDYDERILTVLYARIFASGYIVAQYFITNWTTSKGARWEMVRAIEREVEIVMLDRNHMPI